FDALPSFYLHFVVNGKVTKTLPYKEAAFRQSKTSRTAMPFLVAVILQLTAWSSCFCLVMDSQARVKHLIVTPELRTVLEAATKKLHCSVPAEGNDHLTYAHPGYSCWRNYFNLETRDINRPRSLSTDPEGKHVSC
ncbi:hypothetical protein IscW_ISCW022617, partial [Ixodes scapularis]